MKLTVMAGQQELAAGYVEEAWKNILMLRELCAEMMTLPVQVVQVLAENQLAGNVVVGRSG